MAKEFWDERYRDDEFVYGTEPNVYFKEVIDTLYPAKLLLPGEGEGRNAVYAARKGWKVDCFDISQEAKKKSMQLAEDYNVSIAYEVEDIHSYPWGDEIYDAVGLIYIHNPPDIRKLLHYRSVQSLKPGGMLILEAFHKDQMDYDSGGPRNEAMLYDLEEMERDFNGLQILESKREEIYLSEGRYHKGNAVVVRIKARKPS